MQVIVLGTSGDITTCDCCGKVNLKKTVVLEVAGEVKHYGVNCAALTLKGKKSAANAKIVDSQATAVQMLRNLIAAGKSVDDAAGVVWTRFGYVAIVRGRNVQFAFGEVAV